VRRGTVLERLEQEAEALLGLLGTQADRLEDLALDLGRVDTDRPTAELGPVHDHVVAPAAPGAGVPVEVAGRRGEWVVERVPALLVLVPLERREVDDPEQVVALGRLGRDGQAQLPEHGRRDVRPVGDDQHRVALVRAEQLGRPSHRVLPDELGDG
jgi:hypothetical protein